MCKASNFQFPISNFQFQNTSLGLSADEPSSYLPHSPQTDSPPSLLCDACGCLITVFSLKTKIHDNKIDVYHSCGQWLGVINLKGRRPS